MNNYCLYCHTNKINGKKYFGITGTSVKKRWMNGGGYKSSRHFHFAIQKYGWDNFEHVVLLSGLSKEEACEKEKEYIKRFKTNDDKYGYNISTGGESGACGVKQSEERIWRRVGKRVGTKHTDETKRKMSEAAKGRTFSKETLEKMRYAKLGKPLSEEHKKKLSEAQKGRVLSDDTKEKIRKSKSKMMKKVYCKETKIIYNSISDAAKELNLSRQNISANCRGRLPHTKGYHFNYVEEK